MHRGRGVKPFAVVLALLAAVAVAAAETGRRSAWTTVDEPVHLAAARELADGRGVVSNFEHPVLMKLVSAAGLASRPPGHIVEETRNGRRLFPWLLGLLVLGAGLWARRLAGPVAGAGAAVLVLADPTLRGHAPLVQSDLLLAVCLVWAGFLLDAAARGRRVDLRLAAASGAAYGLALVSKYSALPFLPVFLAVAALRFARARRSGPVPAGVRRKRTGTPSRVRAVSVGAATALLGGTALATAFFVQEAALHGTPRERLRAGIARSLLPVAGEEPTRKALDRAANAPKGVAAYVTGLSYVRAAAAPGARYNYFLGEVSGEGHPLYFVTALLVKAPAAVLAGLFAGLAMSGVAFARWRPALRRRRARVALGRALVPGVLALAYLGAASLSHLNIGVRHAMPCIPLGIVAAIAAFGPLVRPPRRAAWLLGLTVAGAVLEAGLSFGREIPFGNVLAGGPAGVRRILSDSNVDWGERQDLVFDAVRAGGTGRAGAVSLILNADEAGSLGVLQVDDASQVRDLDTVFVSVFLYDLSRALERSGETTRRIEWLREWLPPLVREIEARAGSVESLGDEYLVFRLAPGSGSPRVSGAAPRRSSSPTR